MALTTRVDRVLQKNCGDRILTDMGMGLSKLELVYHVRQSGILRSVGVKLTPSLGAGFLGVPCSRPTLNCPSG